MEGGTYDWKWVHWSAHAGEDSESGVDFAEKDSRGGGSGGGGEGEEWVRTEVVESWQEMKGEIERGVK